MFYLSRAEQAALLILIALLLAGAAVLTYARGKHSADLATGQPIFVPAPAGAIASQPASAAGAGGTPPVANAAPTDVALSGSAASAAHARAKPQTRRAAAASAQPPRGGLVSLNSATEKELDALPGIGPVFAQRIVAYREQRKREGRRGFESKDELLNVPGIGPKRYAAIRDLVTL